MGEKAPELFVFKQSYKSRNLPSTRVLNQKHLVYIATRPGVMRNPECGFGLWGKLPDMKASENVDDLRTACRAVGVASESHTLYRAILSVDRNTAREYDLYDRETWQKLLNTRISVIQREMHIKPEDFRWVASMHYKKNHPHVHILYWDNGKEPREEFVSKERFELISQRVRTTFSRAVYFQKDLSAAKAEQSETAKAARLQLSALLKSANLPDALDLDHVKPAELDELGKGLVDLARTLPSTGRLKYGFLKPEYRRRLDAWLEGVMKISDFAKLERRYTALSAEVTRLYGNDGALAEKFQKEAHDRLFADLGNETLACLKEAALELEAREPPADMQGLSTVTRRVVERLVRQDPAFAALLKSLPKWRAPNRTLLKDAGVKRQVDALSRALAGDLRVRSKAAGYVAAAKSAGSDAKKAEKEAYHAVYSAVRSTVLDAARQELGYDTQERQELAGMALLRLFSSGSQSKNQLQSQRDLQREKHRNLSETAKRDLQKKRQQEGGWSAEL